MRAHADGAGAPDGATPALPSKYAYLVYDMVRHDRIPRAMYHHYTRELRELADGDYVDLDARGVYRVTRKPLPDPEPPPEPMENITMRGPVSLKRRLEAYAAARHGGNASAAHRAILEAALPALDGEGADAPADGAAKRGRGRGR